MELDREKLIESISNPGKFEGEPIYTPYFYDLIMESGQDETVWNEDNPVEVFHVDDTLRSMFPEIDKETTVIMIWEDDMGFVNSSELTKEQWETLELDKLELVEGDLTTEDHRKFFQYGKLVLDIDEDADMWTELDKYMERTQFWPNVWFISDHGNLSLLTK